MRKNIHTSMCLIQNGYQDRAVRISNPNSVIFLFVGLDERRSFERKVDTRDELLARILDGGGCMKKRGDQLEQPRDLRTRVAECIEVDGGIFEHLV
jgi:hypothetical protein